MAEKVKIKIIRSTVCDGVDVFEGDEVEASQRDASLLMRMGKAVPAEIQTKAETAAEKKARLKAEAEAEARAKAEAEAKVA